MIALDPDHAADSDYPIEPGDRPTPGDPLGVRSKFIPVVYSEEDPVWCIWKMRGGDYMPVEPYGRTVDQLLQDDEDEDDDPNYLDEGLECGCGWPDPELPYQSHDDHVESYEYPDHEPSPEWTPPEDED